MAFDYPVSLDVRGRRCIVIGGGALAENRVVALLEAGAEVTVIAPTANARMAELAMVGRLTHLDRDFRSGDLEGAFLAIGATGDPQTNAALWAEANERGVLLNAMDDNPHCHFALPSVLRRGALAVTVSTGGRSPALARRVRRELDDLIGPEYGELVDVVAEVRSELQRRRRAGGADVPADFDTWARRWRDAVAGDLPALVREGRRDEVKAVLLRAMTEAGACSGVGAAALSTRR